MARRLAGMAVATVAAGRACRVGSAFCPTAMESAHRPTATSRPPNWAREVEPRDGRAASVRTTTSSRERGAAVSLVAKPLRFVHAHWPIGREPHLPGGGDQRHPRRARLHGGGYRPSWPRRRARPSASTSMRSTSNEPSPAPNSLRRSRCCGPWRPGGVPSSRGHTPGLQGGPAAKHPRRRPFPAAARRPRQRYDLPGRAGPRQPRRIVPDAPRERRGRAGTKCSGNRPAGGLARSRTTSSPMPRTSGSARGPGSVVLACRTAELLRAQPRPRGPDRCRRFGEGRT